MTRNIHSDYFDWLCSLVDYSKPSRRSYNTLLKYLYDTEFVYIMPMDGNRFSDGINLRYSFGEQMSIDGPVIASCLDDKPCSILEMMVALAVRCEVHIMGDPDDKNRSGRWFWMMISNLGLADMYDSRFDGEYANFVVYRFMNREYEPDGEGGLVYLPNSPYDLRSMEIWYQMMRYLSEYRRNGE